MHDVLYIAIMGLLTLISTIIGSGLTDARKHWHRSLKPKGKVVLYLGLAMLVLSIWQFISTRDEEKREKKKAAEERRAADMAMETGIKKGIDSGLQQISKGLGTSFREQGFKMDSLNFQLSAIRDSARNVKNVPETLPILGIETEGISLDLSGGERNVMINLKSLQAGATNFKLKCYTLTEYRDGGKGAAFHPDFIDYDTEIPQGQGNLVILTLRSQREFDSLKLYITGTFTGINSTTVRKIDEVYIFLPSIKKTYFYRNEWKEALKKEIIEHNRQFIKKE